MDNFLLSFILGFLSTFGLFVLSMVLVLGVKALVSGLKIKPHKTQVQEKPENKTQTVKKPVRKPRPVRSIEIDPEKVDRIYVRKIS